MRDSKNTKNTETIKTIEFVFENCDSVKLLPTDLNQFSISKPKEQHSMEVLECVMFVLKKNKVFYEQGQEEEIGPRTSINESFRKRLVQDWMHISISYRASNSLSTSSTSVIGLQSASPQATPRVS